MRCRVGGEQEGDETEHTSDHGEKRAAALRLLDLLLLQQLLALLLLLLARLLLLRPGGRRRVAGGARRRRAPRSRRLLLVLVQILHHLHHALVRLLPLLWRPPRQHRERRVEPPLRHRHEHDRVARDAERRRHLHRVREDVVDQQLEDGAEEEEALAAEGGVARPVGRTAVRARPGLQVPLQEEVRALPVDLAGNEHAPEHEPAQAQHVEHRPVRHNVPRGRRHHEVLHVQGGLPVDVGVVGGAAGLREVRRRSEEALHRRGTRNERGDEGRRRLPQEQRHARDVHEEVDALDHLHVLRLQQLHDEVGACVKHAGHPAQREADEPQHLLRDVLRLLAQPHGPVALFLPLLLLQQHVVRIPHLHVRGGVAALVRMLQAAPLRHVAERPLDVLHRRARRHPQQPVVLVGLRVEDHVPQRPQQAHHTREQRQHHRAEPDVLHRPTPGGVRGGACRRVVRVKARGDADGGERLAHGAGVGAAPGAAGGGVLHEGVLQVLGAGTRGVQHGARGHMLVRDVVGHHTGLAVDVFAHADVRRLKGDDLRKLAEAVVAVVHARLGCLETACRRSRRHVLPAQSPPASRLNEVQIL
eukprot:Rhum_TRINITY_DN6492_c0_g2::Rhum_TRINITY_DN6492_c0_g2_i1::g.20266::m.20266